MSGDIVASAAAGVQVVIAAMLAVIAARAYARVRSTRVLLVALAFGAVLLQGVVTAWALLSPSLSLETGITAGLALNSLGLLAIYFGVLHRG